MTAVRDLSTEAIGWAKHSLGLAHARLSSRSVAFAPATTQYVTVHDGDCRVLVDLSSASTPTLLVQRSHETLEAFMHAFEDGKRTDAEEIGALRLAHRRGIASRA